MAAGWSEQERGGREGGRERQEDRNQRFGVILWRVFVSHSERGGKILSKLRAEIFLGEKTSK